jgi:hypothetical protein
MVEKGMIILGTKGISVLTLTLVMHRHVCCTEFSFTCACDMHTCTHIHIVP